MSCDSPPPGARFGRNLAVVIGINAYGNGIARLHSAVADAVELARILERDHGFEVWTVLDNKADLTRLETLLDQELPAALGPHDRLLFYFAGHGIAHEAHGYLLPVGAQRNAIKSFLPMSRLHDALARLDARHALVILDCCFSGMFRWSVRDAAAPHVKVYRERYERYLTRAAWQVLTSGSGDQLVLDVLGDYRDDGGQTHSPFARALFAGLAGGADYTDDHLITAEELKLYIREQTAPAAAELGVRQIAQLYQFRKHEDGEFVFQVPNTELALDDAPQLDDDANPYRGLASFRNTDKEAARFFGRDELVARLVTQASALRVTVVVGPSGSGKSSLVQAGAAHRLQASGWTVREPQRPGRDPRAALQVLASPPPDGRWLVIIDQLEELLIHEPGARDDFLSALTTALNASPTLHLIVTVRSDAEPRFRTAALWADAARFDVPAMKRDQLREAIEKPALTAVLHFEPAGLVEHLLDDVALSSAPLPLLSFALSELYRKCALRWQAGDRDRTLRKSDYDAMGRVAGALKERATELHTELVKQDPAYEITLLNVVTRMVADVGGELARRRLLLDELEYGDLAEDARIAEVLRRFADGRLISCDLTATTAQPYVEPAHEEFLRGWPQIGAWRDVLDQPKGTRALRGAIGDAEATWRAAPAQAPLWDADPRIDQAITLAERRPAVLNLHEKRFIEQSALRRDKRRRRTRWRVSIVIAMLLFVATFAIVEAVRATDEADNATASESRARKGEAEARAAQLVSEAHRVSAMLDAPGGWLDGVPTAMAATWPRLATGQTPDALQGALARAVFAAVPVVEIRWPSVFALAISDDEQMLATGDDQGRLRLWRTDTGEAIAAAKVPDRFRAVAISTDGRAVVTAGQAGARVWTTYPLVNRCTITCDSELIAVKLSPNGRTVLTTCTDYSHGVYEVPSCELITRIDHQRVRRGQSGELQGPYLANMSDLATFSRDSQRVALPTRGGGFEVWNLRPLRRVVAVDRGGTEVRSAVFARDAERVLTTRSDHRVAVWDLDHPDKPVRTQYTSSAAISPDDRALTAISPDGRALIVQGAGVINLDTGDVNTGLVGADLTWPAFSRDNERVVALGTDGLVRIWDALTSEVVTVLRGHDANIDAVGMSISGSMIATSGRDGVVRLWNTSRAVASQPASIDRLELAASGMRALSRTEDGSVQLWNATTGALIAQLPPRDNKAFELRFSDDGRRALIASSDEIRVLDTDVGKLVLRISIDKTSFNSADISRDGSQVLIGVFDGSPRLWDVATRTELATITPAEGVTQVRFGDGDHVWLFRRTRPWVTVDRQGSVIEWSRAAGVVRTLHDDGADLEAMRVAPDRVHVLTIHRRDNLRVGWLWGPGNARVALTDPVGVVRTESVDADATFSPDGTRVATFAFEPTARVWDVATGQLLTTVRVDATAIDDATLDDHARLTTHDAGGLVRMWSLDGTEIGAFDRVAHARISRDGTRLIASAGRRLRVFELRHTAVFSAGCALLRGLCDLPALSDAERDQLRAACALPARPACNEPSN